MFLNIGDIKIGDKFQRYSFDKDGNVIKNGIIECTFINTKRYMFRYTGCSDVPEGYIFKVPATALYEAIFNNCPGVEKIS